MDNTSIPENSSFEPPIQKVGPDLLNARGSERIGRSAPDFIFGKRNGRSQNGGLDKESGIFLKVKRSNQDRLHGRFYDNSPMALHDRGFRISEDGNHAFGLIVRRDLFRVWINGHHLAEDRSMVADRNKILAYDARKD